MKLEEAIALDKKHLFQNYKRTALLVSGGAGTTLFDDNGKRYLDFISGVGCNALGYGDPVVAAVLRKAAEAPLHVSNLFHHPFTGPLAEKLTKLSGLDRVLFQNSGTEAVEAGIKIARAVAKSKGEKDRIEVLAFSGSFHGRTFAALSATSTEKYRLPFEPLVPGFYFHPFNQVDGLEKAIGKKTAAVMIEPLQGEGGLSEATPEFLKALRQACDKAGALLILDEIQSGLGRTGKFLHSQHAGVRGDIVLLAKPLGLGIPLAAVLASEAVASAIHPGDHGTTFGGNPLACRLSLELVERLENRLQGQIQETGSYFHSRLEELSSMKEVEEVRGRGLMLGLKLRFDAEKVVEKAFEAGFLINRTAGSVLRFLPPFVVRKEEIDQLVNALPAAIRGGAKSV